MKLKEIKMGGGGKISRKYQTQDYTVAVTVEVEDGDKPSTVIEKTKECLKVVREVAKEMAEKELERLIKEKKELTKKSKKEVDKW